MTLHEFPGLEQGTDAWHDARRGIVTASVVGRLINPTLKVADNDYSRGITAALIAERIAGWTEPSYTNADMWRGVECEPIARGAYTQHYAPAVECGFLRRDEPTWSLGYSPDGLVGDDGLIEIKAPRAKGHVATILADNVPAQYMAQCQAGLLVTGRKWLDFVSFCGGLPLYVKRIEPDPRWLEVIVAAVEKFETTAAEMVAAYTEATEGLPATERVVELEMSL
jgi:putative phage-type endonuclease